MAVYSLGVRGANSSVGTCAFEIRAASTDRPRLYELGVSMVNASASFLGLGRAVASGTSPVNPALFLAKDSTDPVATVVGAVSWVVPPTEPTAFIRRFHVPGVVGATVILTFPQGLVIPVSSSLVVWNIVSNAIFDLWAVIEE